MAFVPQVADPPRGRKRLGPDGITGAQEARRALIDAARAQATKASSAPGSSGPTSSSPFETAPPMLRSVGAYSDRMGPLRPLPHRRPVSPSPITAAATSPIVTGCAKRRADAAPPLPAKFAEPGREREKQALADRNAALVAPILFRGAESSRVPHHAKAVHFGGAQAPTGAPASSSVLGFRGMGNRAERRPSRVKPNLAAARRSSAVPLKDLSSV